jgi:hypothetical protein
LGLAQAIALLAVNLQESISVQMGYNFRIKMPCYSTR